MEVRNKVDVLKNVFFAGCAETMGILRDTLRPAVDVRLEKLRYIEALQEPKTSKLSVKERFGVFFAEIFNRLLALIFFTFTFPLITLISLWIKLDSPGPVFFRQERMGLHGRIFRIFKFRTMVFDAEKNTGPVLASVDDERITRVGRILRHLRIDEIPQMLNVINGHMALVGPRPERPEIYDTIIQDWPEFFVRLEVKPGITGLAQIRGNYHTEPRDKLRYDLLYIKRKSLWLDIKIIAITAYICLLKKGAC
jgi:lipopolysaccharide/colanic/teichoic acid biosynthesis glycosyltransferase